MPAGPDPRCGVTEPAKPWGTGWWVCKKQVSPRTGSHRGPHSFDEHRTTMGGYHTVKRRDVALAPPGGWVGMNADSNMNTYTPTGSQ